MKYTQAVKTAKPILYKAILDFRSYGDIPVFAVHMLIIDTEKQDFVIPQQINHWTTQFMKIMNKKCSLHWPTLWLETSQQKVSHSPRDTFA